VSIATQAPVFDALGDPTRLRIVVELCDAGPRTTSEVTDVVTMSRQATTKHLVVLETAGLVYSIKRGRERIWTVQPQSLTAAGDYLDVLSSRWDRAIERLRAFVEDPAEG
jgi:DNA-binding transcriptional ArsR family regulator